MSGARRILGCTLAGLFVLSVGVATAHPPRLRFPLERGAWVGLVSARRVVRERELDQAVRAWMGHPGDHLMLLYPAGSAGRVWASEVADWLVALGIPRHHLILRPHLARHANRLWIELVRHAP